MKRRGLLLALLLGLLPGQAAGWLSHSAWQPGAAVLGGAAVVVTLLLRRWR